MSTKERKTLVVNLAAGPGAGKSTTALGIAYHLKKSGFIVSELVTEYAKDLVWDGALSKLDNQVYVFSKQYARVARLLGKVHVVITDSPIYLSLAYEKNEVKTFKPFVLDLHNSMDTLNIFIKRVKPYLKVGRNQTEEEARELDRKVENIMIENSISYHTVNGDEDAVESILEMVYSWIMDNDPGIKMFTNPYGYTMGHKIIYIPENDEWVYEDTKYPVQKETRSCTLCHKLPTEKGHDPCIADLPGVSHACCGHGVDHPASKPYLVLDNGDVHRFDTTEELITFLESISQ